MKTIEEYVWFYFNHGFGVIPLGNNNYKTDKEKKPSTGVKWEKYQEKRADKEQVAKWLKEGKFKGIGVQCGIASNDMNVIDVDDKEIIQKLNLNFDDIVKTGNWVSKTHKGYHIWTQNIKKSPLTTVNTDVHIDYKATGYIVAPPSLHPKGTEYEFIHNDFKPLVPIDTEKTYQDMVNKVIEEQEIKPKVKIKTSGVKELSDTTPICIELLERRNDLKDGMGRNEYATVLLSYYKKQNSRKSAITLINKWNRQQYDALEQSELDTIIDSIFKPKAKLKGCPARIKAGLCPFRPNTRNISCKFYSSMKKQELLDHYKVCTYKKDKIDKINYMRLARLILDNSTHSYISIKDENDKEHEIYAYADGVYEYEHNDRINKEVISYLGDSATPSGINQVNFNIQSILKAKSREDLKPPLNLINVKNGIVDINQYDENTKSLKLIPHTPEYVFFTQIPHNYDIKAECPKIIEYFRTVFKEGIETKTKQIQEMYGFTFYRMYTQAVMFILYGSGRNGKGVTETLLQSLLGERNFHTAMLSTILQDRFTVANLYNKLANICGEMSYDELKKNIKVLKMLIGKDFINAQFKNRNQFKFRNHAKLIFNTNVIPYPVETTDAFYDRVVIIMYLKKFYKTSIDTNPNLGEELISDKKEMEGLLKWSLEGLRRIIKEKTFTGAKTPKEMENLYNYLVNTEKDWLKEHYEPSQDVIDIQDLDEIHELYCKWCDEENIPSQTKSGLASTIYFMWVKPENTWTKSKTQRRKDNNITTYRCLKKREY